MWVTEMKPNLVFITPIESLNYSQITNEEVGSKTLNNLPIVTLDG